MAAPISSPTRRRRIRVGAVLTAAAMVFAACGTDDDSDAAAPAQTDAPAAPDAPVVLASTTIWADVVSNVACGQLQVESLVPLGVDAHDFEPSVQEADQLRGADLVVFNGLGLEEGLEATILDAGESGVEVLEVGTLVTPIEFAGEHGHSHGDDDHGHDEEKDGHDDDHGHSHEGDDPHVWMDPARVAQVVPSIETALAGLDGLPVDDEELADCAAAYVDELDDLSEEMSAAFSQLSPEQRRIVTNHEALGYLADAFDLEIIGTVIPSTSTLAEPNARELDELADTMEAAGVTRIYGEVTGSNEVAEALADRIGDAEVVSLFTESLGPDGSGATTYIDMMRTNTDLITGGS